MTAFKPCGVRIAGAGSAIPQRVVTNKDLEEVLDTTDEWIHQRTGIRERRMVDHPNEGAFDLECAAIRRALDSAGMQGSDLDLVINASVTSEMRCPSNASRIVEAIGADPAGAFDLMAACSGFVYALNIADTLVRTGRHRAVGVIGCDALSTISDYTERTVSILFGDAAGAVICVRDDDPNVGCMFQTMGGEATKWRTLYMPELERDVLPEDAENTIRLRCLRMQGREVFRFAVNRFRETIEEALQATGLTVDDVSQFVCHQSNARIIEAAKQKLGLPDEKVHVNIDRIGNTSAGSCPVVFDELWQAGKIRRGDIVVFVAFGGGLTFASNVWRI